jgi:predicted nucleic acid-binding Zn ribbon protein
MPIYSVSRLKYCEACGTPITPGVSFCTNCGSRIRQETKTPKRAISARSILVTLVVLMAGVAAGSLLVRPEVPTSQMLAENTVVSVSPTTFTVVTTLTPASSIGLSSTTSTSVISITTSSSSTTPLATLQQATTYSSLSTQIRTSSTISYRSATTSTKATTSSTITYRSSTTYVPPPTSTSRSGCDPSYPTVCIPPPPPDLDCKDIQYRNFVVLPPDPHHFDGDHDGIGCET